MDHIEAGLFGGVIFQCGTRAESIRSGRRVTNDDDDDDESPPRRSRHGRREQNDQGEVGRDRSQEGLKNASSLLWKKEKDGSYQRAVPKDQQLIKSGKSKWVDPKPDRPTGRKGPMQAIQKPPAEVKGPMAVAPNGMRVSGRDWDIAKDKGDDKANPMRDVMNPKVA